MISIFSNTKKLVYKYMQISLWQHHRALEVVIIVMVLLLTFHISQSYSDYKQHRELGYKVMINMVTSFWMVFMPNLSNSPLFVYNA